jgi:ferredoxin
MERPTVVRHFANALGGVMAKKILEECINCGSCEPECPNKAISQGDPIYTINRDLCTECAGVADSPRCVELCPIEGCIVAA